MGSRGFVTILVLWYLFLFSSLSCPCSAVRVSTSASQKVSLALYYETLCPYCSNFMVNRLAKIFQNGLITIVDLKLVPYGNARVGPNSTITCQHGPYECLLNTVEACAINVWPDLNKHFSFINCVELLVTEGKYPEWESCFGKIGLDSKPIADCYNSGHGKKLELQYANQTNALQPPHTYVPWVTVNGKPLLEDYENFVTFVCKAYKGTAVPMACKAAQQIIPNEKVNPTPQVCYAEKAKRVTASSSSSTTMQRIWAASASRRRQMKMESSA